MKKPFRWSMLGVDNWWDYLFAPYETKRSLVIDLVHFAGEEIRIQVKSASQASGTPSGSFG